MTNERTVELTRDQAMTLCAVLSPAMAEAIAKLPYITVDEVLTTFNRHIAPVHDVETRIEVQTETRQFHHTAMLRYMGEGEYRLLCPSCGKPSRWLQMVTDKVLWCGDGKCLRSIVEEANANGNQSQ
jgi:hypothetical protein